MRYHILIKYFDKKRIYRLRFVKAFLQFLFIFVKAPSADDLKGGEQESEDIVVTLSKSPGRGLGLSVVGRRDGCGVFISDMVSHRIPYRCILYGI